ncbi:MAG: PfkB family carbohydrate kinase [Dehalococcoidia bacterium]
MCEDRVPGGWRPGGPSLFSAVAAQRLGATVHLHGAEASGSDAFTGCFHVSPSGGRPARYENRYDEAGARTQLILDRGSPLAMPLAVGGDAVIVAPAYHELGAVKGPLGARLAGVCLQGVLRSALGRRVRPRARPWPSVRPLIVEGAWAFFSDEDTPGYEALAARLVGAGMRVFVTRGPNGAILYDNAGMRAYRALPARPVDPTGAGDCFATAFIVRLAETEDVETAARFALAAGALAVEGHGLAGVPDRAMVEARLERVAA